MLTHDQIAFFHEHGYLHLPAVFDAEETAQLREDLDWLIRVWANVGVGWTGPWRKQIMDLDTEAKSKLIAMHDLHFYTDAWMRAVTKPTIATTATRAAIAATIAFVRSGARGRVSRGGAGFVVGSGAHPSGGPLAATAGSEPSFTDLLRPRRRKAFTLRSACLAASRSQRPSRTS